MEQKSSGTEQFQTRDQYAGFGRRFLAYFVDFAILFGISILIQLALGRNPLAAFTSYSLAELRQTQNSSSTWISSILGFLAGYVYYALFYVRADGATPGKKLMAIKVTKDDGAHLGYGTVLVRYISTILSGVFFGLGYLWVIWDKRKQAWHDKLAKTVVVETDKEPQTVLATLITVVTILVVIAYMSLSLYQGFRLGLAEIKSKKGIANGQLTPGKTNPEFKTHYDRSMELFKQMRDPKVTPATVQKLNDENIAELKKALELDPKSAEAWYQLGNAYTWISSTGSLEESLAAYKKAEELDPKNVPYINGVGDMLLRMEKYDEAILQFQKTFRLTDKSAYAHLSAGRAYAKLRIYDQAREHLQKAIDVFTSENKDGSYDQEILQARKDQANLPAK